MLVMDHNDGVFSMPFMSEKIALSARKQTHAHVRANGHKGTMARPPPPRQEMPLLFLAHLEQHRLKHGELLLIEMFLLELNAEVVCCVKINCFVQLLLYVKQRFHVPCMSSVQTRLSLFLFLFIKAK